MKRGPRHLAELRETITRSYGGRDISPGEVTYMKRHLNRYAQTIHFLPAQPGRLLDAGSFPGHTSILAAARGWSVTGISKIDGMFVTNDFAERMKENDVAILDVDIEREVIPLDDETFDCVFFNEIIEHLPFNPFHALDQVWRVLKPNGLLVFSVPNLASFDHIWALLRGRSFYPEVTRSLEDAYHADIGQRHIREYTLEECKYLLSHQDKYLYRFNVDRTVMDRSWDGIFYTEHGYERNLRLIKPGTILRSLVTRISRLYRSNIIILARKPKNYFTLADAIVEEGFFPPETSGNSASFVRTPLQSRWMRSTATISLQLPAAITSVNQIDLLIWMPAPASAGTLHVESRINGTNCDLLTISPSVEPIRRVLKPLQPVPCDGEKQTLTIQLRSTEWSPKSLGISSDDRSMGPMLSLEHIGVTAQQNDRQLSPGSPCLSDEVSS
ncbi:class I SAM-dependent methyltransferase [Verrucomicrobiota bacterium]